MRRRVVVTGLGVVASIGNDSQAVLDALRTGRSGISFSEVYAEMGFRSQVHGDIKLDLEEKLGRRLRRFMGDGVAYAHVAMSEAVADAGLAAHEVSNERTGLIMGAGGPSSSNLVAAADIARERGARRVGPYMVPRCMASSESANLARPQGALIQRIRRALNEALLSFVLVYSR